jgi:hypothetical protein
MDVQQMSAIRSIRDVKDVLWAKPAMPANVLTLANPVRLNNRYTSVGFSRSKASSPAAERVRP